MSRLGFGPRIINPMKKQLNKKNYEECEVQEEEEPPFININNYTRSLITKPKLNKLSSRSTQAMNPTQGRSKSGANVNRGILKELTQLKMKFKYCEKKYKGLEFGERNAQERGYYIAEFYKMEDFISNYIAIGGVLYTFDKLEGLGMKIKRLKASIENFTNGFEFYSKLEGCLRKAIFLVEHEDRGKQQNFDEVDEELRKVIAKRRRALIDLNKNLEVRKSP